MKRLGPLLLLVSALLGTGRGSAWADRNPANDFDSLTLTIHQIVDLGVDIDTAAVTLDFTLPMGSTDYTLTPATVTILGTVQPQELDVSAQNMSVPADAWTIDADELAAEDELQLYALFSVGRSSRPLEAEFAGTKNLVTSTVKRAGTLSGSGANGNFENNAMTGGADMDGLNVNVQRQLWLRMDTPPTTTKIVDQLITITISATRTNM